MVEHGADQQGVCAGKGAGLGGAHDAEADQDDQQDREQNGPDTIQQSFQDLRQWSRMIMLGLVAEAAGAPGDGQHQQHAHQDAGDPASHEQTANGDLADGAVDDQAHARRNGGDDQAGQAVDGGRPAAVVAQTGHLRSEDAALHRSICNRRTGDAAHQGGHQAGDLTDVAVHMAGAGVGKAHQALGDAAAVHQVAGQNEQGDGQHGKALRSGNGFLHQNGHGQVADHKEREARQTDGECHGHTQQQKHKEDTDCNKH